MTFPCDLRKIGDEVLMLDSRGNVELRGEIVGVYACHPPIYDLHPKREFSLSRRICGVPEWRLRSVCRPNSAYERR